jgi:acyl-CoA reductase-like NAD-dependent aldehyde dehydrogenase
VTAAGAFYTFTSQGLGRPEGLAAGFTVLAAYSMITAAVQRDRARLPRRFAEVVDGDRENLARLAVVNSGHTIGNARWEAGNVRDGLHCYAAAPERLIGKQIPVPGGVNLTFAERLASSR